MLGALLGVPGAGRVRAVLGAQLVAPGAGRTRVVLGALLEPRSANEASEEEQSARA